MENNLARHLPNDGEVVQMEVDVEVLIHRTPRTLSSEEPNSFVAQMSKLCANETWIGKSLKINE